MEYRQLPDAIDAIIKASKNSSQDLAKENFILKAKLFKLETEIEELRVSLGSTNSTNLVVGAAAGLSVGVMLSGK